jgi:hypothetical protein
MLNEGDAALNWDACTGVNKTASRITTETVFECRTAREAEYVFSYRTLRLFLQGVK